MILRLGYTVLSLSLLCLFPSLLPLASAATPTSFCKCTCFESSYIIPLDEPPKATSTVTPHGILLASRTDEAPIDGDEPAKEYRPGNCNDCNRQFCLGYNLPICKGATEKDVFATCFQRDSRKDETVVFIFIFATVGLLGWSFIRPWVHKWVESARERRNYIPVASAGEAT